MEAGRWRLVIPKPKKQALRATPRVVVDNDPIEGARLLSKAEVLYRVGVTFPTVWKWMRQGKFPRSRSLDGKSFWLASEIDAWIAALPVRPLKGDDANPPMGAA